MTECCEDVSSRNLIAAGAGPDAPRGHASHYLVRLRPIRASRRVRILSDGDHVLHLQRTYAIRGGEIRFHAGVELEHRHTYPRNPDLL